MNESETRAEHIDPALKAAGWGVVEGSRVRREFSISPGRIEGRGRRGKPLIADYVLEYRNTRLAVVEAKAWDRPLTEGVGQAKEYAGRLSIRFAYATNVHFKGRQQVFLDFVLDHYVSVGVDELDTGKLTPLLKLKYNDSISDALADLGAPDEINRLFCGFQQYLYREPVVA